MGEPSRTGTRQGRLALLALFALFFAPIVLALLLNLEAPHWMPFGMRNHGELVEPPVLLAPAGLRRVPGDGAAAGADLMRDRWTIVQIAAGGCDRSCAEALVASRQARLGLGKDRVRVRRLLVLVGGSAPADLASLRREHPDLALAMADRGWLAGLPGGGARWAGAAGIVDPLGYLMMRYPPPPRPRDLVEDLERLLKISKIG